MATEIWGSEKQLSVSEARRRFTGLYDEAGETGTIAVTNKGRPELAIMRWELYEAIVETLEILGDQDLMAQLRKSVEAVRNDDIISLEDLEERIG